MNYSRMSPSTLLVLMLLFPLLGRTGARTLDLMVDGDAVPSDDSLAAARRNGAAFNATLARLEPGDALVVPRGYTFHVMGGIICKVSYTLVRPL